ncbi:MAG TPA: hypothetical protein VME46_14870, partial [Acidimicrobiales bacterium]|nr:hypothetical protein [Acidimicrobiales bacterium]
AATTTAANDNLSAYWSSFSQSPWPPDTNNCWIWFAGADVVNGPTFSNDTIRDGLDGDATFYGQVFSAAAGRNDSFTGAVEPCEYDTNDNPNTIACRAGPATGTPPVFLGDEPEPTTAADAQAAQLVGCYISGGTLASPTPTWVDITMTENGSTTTLKWWANASAPNSPNVDNATANGGNPNGGSGGACGTSGATSAHPSTVTVSSLKSALIYVDGNVTVSTPASNTCGTYTSTDNCEAGFLTIIAGDDTAVGAAEWGSNPSAGDIYLGDSIAYPNTDVSTTAVNCPAGVWAQGGGIANNTCPRSDPADALGLVAQYFIQYPQAPNNCPGTPYTIDAALLTLTDSVYADNWGNGGPCTLNVFGAIGQNFRGPVGTSGPSGYEKDYYYDTSLETLWPPYYLASTSSGWEPFGYAEGKPGTAQRALANVNYAAACGAAC